MQVNLTHLQYHTRAPQVEAFLQVLWASQVFWFIVLNNSSCTNYMLGKHKDLGQYGPYAIQPKVCYVSMWPLCNTAWKHPEVTVSYKFCGSAINLTCFVGLHFKLMLTSSSGTNCALNEQIRETWPICNVIESKFFEVWWIVLTNQ